MFFGGVIKKRRSGQITMEFSQKFIDNLLGFFKVTAKVSTMVSRFPWFRKRIKSSVTRKVIHFSGQQ